MKNIFIVILVIIVVGVVGGFGYWYTQKRTTVYPSPAPLETKSPDIASNAACIPDQLQAQITPQGAAGNIFASVSIKNISTTDCQIIGNNNLTAQFDGAVKNIKTSPQGQPSITTFTLTPNQTVYSQIHYPNGPQCSAAPKLVDVIFSYQISSDQVIFKTPTGNSLQVPSCQNPSEITTLDVWALSEKPITP